MRDAILVQNRLQLAKRFLSDAGVFCITIDDRYRRGHKVDKLCHRWHNKNMKCVFKARHFSRSMRKTELTIHALCDAVAEMAQGLIDADLGGGVVKKRVGLAGRGKRGGARTLVATNKADRWFFVFGFEKNERANIADDELDALQDIAMQLLARTGRQLDEAVKDGSLQEICNDDKSES